MPRARPSDSPAPAETLDPGLLRLIEALARAHVDEDYAAAQQSQQHEPTT